MQATLLRILRSQETPRLGIERAIEYVARQGECRANHYTSKLIGLLGRVRSWERGMALFTGMRKRHLKPDDITHSAIISAYEKCRNWLGALEL